MSACPSQTLYLSRPPSFPHPAQPPQRLTWVSLCTSSAHTGTDPRPAGSSGASWEALIPSPGLPASCTTSRSYFLPLSLLAWEWPELQIAAAPAHSHLVNSSPVFKSSLAYPNLGLPAESLTRTAREESQPSKRCRCQVRRLCFQGPAMRKWSSGEQSQDGRWGARAHRAEGNRVSNCTWRRKAEKIGARLCLEQLRYSGLQATCACLELMLAIH